MDRVVRIGVAAVVGMAATSVAFANDSTIPCSSPPESGASVAVHPGTQVSKTQDKQKNTCTFSVNGAVATSPPPEQVLAALNVFRDPAAPYLRDSNLLATSIAALAAASAPVDEVPSELVDLIKKNTVVFTACLKRLAPKEFTSGTFNGSGDPICLIVEPYREPADKRAQIEKMGAALGEPNVVITIPWGQGRFISTVYLPVAMVGQPALPLPRR